MPNKKIVPMNFAERYRRLQVLIEWFEQEDINLEEGLKKFEEGATLVRELKEYLAKMENKITELKNSIE